MRLLHTSDWHLGRTLYGRRRYDEFTAFLDWLAETLVSRRVDALLVAGDVFDTTAPSNRAQELYYRFLCRVAASSCRHVVVIAGNHDSPSFLNAPRELLKTLRVHVVGQAARDPGEEALVLDTPEEKPALIVCAVPYLRDRDIRVAEAGESVSEKERKLLEGIRDHYGAVAARAAQIRIEQGADLPIIATGHLFTAGGQTVDGDGVRELYIGSLARVSAATFPAGLAYVALGHLHVAQRVNGLEHVRYSGAPLPMGFGEAGRRKTAVIVDFGEGGQTEAQPSIEVLEIPVFQRIERLSGGWDEIAAGLAEYARSGESVWLEIVYDGDEIIGDLRARVDAAVSETRLEVLRLRNNRIIDRILVRDSEESLDDLEAEDVFERCLAAHEVPEVQRPELRDAFRETLIGLFEHDSQAE